MLEVHLSDVPHLRIRGGRGASLRFVGLVVVSVGCGYLVTTIYAQTTDFEKACTTAAAKFPGSGSAAEGGIMSEYSRLTGVQASSEEAV